MHISLASVMDDILKNPHPLPINNHTMIPVAPLKKNIRKSGSLVLNHKAS